MLAIIKPNRLALIVLALSLATGACASKKKKTDPVLSELEGKKVALVSVEGERTARSVIEVALINQIVKNGTFILVSKQDIEKARSQPEMKPDDPLAVARACGAEYALQAKVLEFDAETREGYSKEEIDDSQLEEERGDGKTERIYKVKSMTGKVAVELKFTNLSKDEVRSAVAEDTEVVVKESKTEAARLPPKLRFLEQLTNKAFQKFFERYN